MEEQKKKTSGGKKMPNMPQVPKFNFYWIYGILAVVFISLQYFSFNNELKEITWNRFEEMLLRHDVEKVVVINNKYAEVYIKKDKLASSADTTYKDVKTKGFGNAVNPGPHFTMKFLSVDAFRDDMKDIQQRIFARDTIGKTPQQVEEIREKDRVVLTADERRNWGGEVFSYILPILLLVGVWFLIMRMMNRGGAGGTGQIFNFGKIKKIMEVLFYPKKEKDLPEAELLTIAVKNEFQGQGIAGNMLEKFIYKKDIVRSNGTQVLVNRMTGEVKSICRDNGQEVPLEGQWKEQYQKMYDSQNAPKNKNVEIPEGQ